jgi:hypothetical protein
MDGSMRPHGTWMLLRIAGAARPGLRPSAAVVAACLALAGPLPANEVLSDAQADQARKLVRQLGDGNYRIREQASEKLIRMGSAVAPVLREGLAYPDPEIRFRCRIILPRAMSYDLERRLQPFLAGKEDRDHPPLASWKKFKTLVGDSGKTRELFAAMFRCDSDFLGSLENHPAQLHERMSARCVELNQSLASSSRSVCGADQLALLLLASLEPRVKMDPDAQSYLSSALVSLSLRPHGKDMLKTNEPIRKLLIQYIANCNGYTAHNGLYVLATLQLKEAPDIARRFLKDSECEPYNRALAMSILGKIAGKASLPDILPFIDDATAVGETQFGRGSRIKTQLRDVALATLVQMSGQSLADYNFDYLKIFGGNTGLDLHLSPGNLGFSEDSTREASIKRWKDWYAKNKALFQK